MELLALSIFIYTMVYASRTMRPKLAFAQASIQGPTDQDGEGVGLTISLFENESSDVHKEKITKAGELLFSRRLHNNNLMKRIQDEAKAQFEEKKAAKAKKGNVTELPSKA